jgi:peptide/nickel transport system permease protein
MTPGDLPDPDEGVEVHRRRRHPIARFVAWRVAVGVGLLAGISVLVFAATSALPGDAASAILGRNAETSALKILNRELGLDKPAPVRYWDWLVGLLHGSFGHSIVSGETVWSIIGFRTVNTLILAAAAGLVLIPLALVLGVIAGRRPGSIVDNVVSSTTLAMIAAPEFILATLLIYIFAVRLSDLPAVSILAFGGTPLSDPKVLVLPVATLVIVGAAYIIRMVRAGVVEVMTSDYVQMARLNGVPERRVVFKHGLRNALAPTVQVIALTLQWLIGGLFVVETVFAYPGIGAELVQAVIARDIPVVQAVAMMIAGFYIGINILADVAVMLLIPKLRTAA